MSKGLEQEFKKISQAFKNVKKDLEAVRAENIILREDVFYLKNKIQENRKNIRENKQTIDNVDKKEIVGNSESKKFHYSDCAYAKKISKENRVHFASIEDAVKQGYDECSCIREDN